MAPSQPQQLLDWLLSPIHQACEMHIAIQQSQHMIVSYWSWVSTRCPQKHETPAHLAPIAWLQGLEYDSPIGPTLQQNALPGVLSPSRLTTVNHDVGSETIHGYSIG